jgi:hypothetical protein
MVELALVSTTLFALIFGLLTFVLVEASDVSGTNAAREGARQATLNYSCADVHFGCTNPNPALSAVTASVVSKLGSLVVGSPTISVTCFDGSATPLVVKNCDPSVIVPDIDLVRVSVTWTRMSSTAFGTSSTHTDTATMSIQGSGQGTSDATACIVTSASVNPTTASIGPGQTSGPLWPSTAQVTITANTNSLCPSLYVSFPTGSSPDQSSPKPMVSGINGAFTDTINASDYNWEAGTYNVTFSDGVNPYSISPTPTITITSAVCSITAASVNPSAALLSGQSPSGLTASVTLSVTTSAGCVHVTTSFTPNSSPTPTSVAMTGSAPNFSLTIGPNDFSWTPGAKQFTFTDADTGKVLQTPQSVILQVATACAISVTLSPSSMAHNNIQAVAVSASPVQGADCTGLQITYAYKNNGSASASLTLQPSGVYTYTIPSSTGWTKGTWTVTFSSNNTSAVTTSPSPIYEVVS